MSARPTPERDTALRDERRAGFLICVLSAVIVLAVIWSMF